jgi:hypothetical protein
MTYRHIFQRQARRKIGGSAEPQAALYRTDEQLCVQQSTSQSNNGESDGSGDKAAAVGEDLI